MIQPVGNRTTEAEMRLGVLHLAASMPGGSATTTQAKREIHRFVMLTDADHELSRSRPGEPKYYHVVGNVVVSHVASPGNIFAKGLALRDADGHGYAITPLGWRHLRELGMADG